MESKSVCLLFFVFLIKLHCGKMFQIDVWSKGENIKRNLSSTSTAHNYLYLLQSVKYVSKAKQFLTLKISFGNQWGQPVSHCSPRTQPWSNTIAHAARWSLESLPASATLGYLLQSSLFFLLHFQESRDVFIRT